MANLVKIQGLVTADAKVLKFASGSTLITFSVADHNRYTDKNGNQVDEVQYWKVNDWRGLEITDSLKKGTPVVVEGRAREVKFTRKNGQPGSDREVNVNKGNSITLSIRRAKTEPEKAAQ